MVGPLAHYQQLNDSRHREILSEERKITNEMNQIRDDVPKQDSTCNNLLFQIKSAQSDPVESDSSKGLFNKIQNALNRPSRVPQMESIERGRLMVTYEGLKTYTKLTAEFENQFRELNSRLSEAILESNYSIENELSSFVDHLTMNEDNVSSPASRVEEPFSYSLPMSLKDMEAEHFTEPPPDSFYSNSPNA